MTLLTAANLLAAVVSAAFVVGYGLLAPWWRSPLGAGVWLTAAGVLALEVGGLLRRVEDHRSADVVIFVAYLIVSAGMVVLSVSADARRRAALREDA